MSLDLAKNVDVDDCLDIPEGVVVIKKGDDYTESLSEHLIAWGLFG